MTHTCIGVFKKAFAYLTKFLQRQKRVPHSRLRFNKCSRLRNRLFSLFKSEYDWTPVKISYVISRKCKKAAQGGKTNRPISQIHGAYVCMIRMKYKKKENQSSLKEVECKKIEVNKMKTQIGEMKISHCNSILLSLFIIFLHAILLSRVHIGILSKSLYPL